MLFLFLPVVFVLFCDLCHKNAHASDSLHIALVGVRRHFPGGTTSTFYLSLQVPDDAMQVDVHKTFYPFYTTKKMPYVTATVTKVLTAIAKYIAIS